MIHLKVNGVAKQYAGDPDMPLLWYLRDEAGPTGLVTSAQALAGITVEEFEEHEIVAKVRIALEQVRTTVDGSPLILVEQK